MDDTISRRAAIEAMSIINDSICEQQASDALCELPSAQPEIIRCRDCRYKYGSACDNFAGVWVKDDDFCSRAERREVSE